MQRKQNNWRVMTCLGSTLVMRKATSNGWKTRRQQTFPNSHFAWGVFAIMFKSTNSWKYVSRFNPSRIDASNAGMTLAAVMNGKGNGNKDEVALKLQISRSLWCYSPVCCFNDNMYWISSCTWRLEQFRRGERIPLGDQWAAWLHQLEVIFRDLNWNNKHR